MKKIIIILLFVIPVIAAAQVKIDYPGDIEPKDSALLFAPELINTGLFTRDFSMSPDGKEIYFSIMAGRSAVIMVSKFEHEKWQEPEIASFSGADFFDFEPHISADGNKIYFLTTRPSEGQEAKLGWQNQNIFVVDRTEQGWSEPYDIGAPVNTVNNEFYPSLTNDGKIYFNHSIEFTDVAIYCSEYKNEEFLEPQKLTFKNDSNLLLYNATVSRDEDFILACGSIKGTRKPARYYAAFNLGNNNWSDLYDLTDYLGYEGGRAASISISPDGKYIFFSAIVNNEQLTKVYPGMTISDIIEKNMKPQSGSSNIYWISSDFINEVKSKYLH
ncbi:TolB family protein [Bacteroidota bacterium]